jgi:hypothetical protein
VTELGIWPCAVRFEVRRANEDGGGIIGGSLEVEGAIDSCLQACIVQGVVLGIAPDSNVRLRSGEFAQICQKVVRECIWQRVISCAYQHLSKLILNNTPAKSGKEENSIE